MEFFYNKTNNKQKTKTKQKNKNKKNKTKKQTKNTRQKKNTLKTKQKTNTKTKTKNLFFGAIPSVGRAGFRTGQAKSDQVLYGTLGMFLIYTETFKEGGGGGGGGGGVGRGADLTAPLNLPLSTLKKNTDVISTNVTSSFLKHL